MTTPFCVHFVHTSLPTLTLSPFRLRRDGREGIAQAKACGYGESPYLGSMTFPLLQRVGFLILKADACSAGVLREAFHLAEGLNGGSEFGKIVFGEIADALES